MNEVKRFTGDLMYGKPIESRDGVFVYAVDFDRVTAERDAARDRINELLEDFQEMSEQADRRGVQASEFEDRMGDLQVKNGKLQQRLTAADERNDVLEGLLRRVVDSSALSFEQDAPEELESLEADICAALKPAEGGGDA